MSTGPNITSSVPTIPTPMQQLNAIYGADLVTPVMIAEPSVSVKPVPKTISDKINVAIEALKDLARDIASAADSDPDAKSDVVVTPVEKKVDWLWEDGHVFEVGDYVDATTLDFKKGEYLAAVITDMNSTGIVVHFLCDNVGGRYHGRLHHVKECDIRRPNPKNVPDEYPYNLTVHGYAFDKTPSVDYIKNIKRDHKLRALVGGKWVCVTYLGRGHKDDGSDTMFHFLFDDNFTMHSISDVHAWWKMTPLSME